MSQLDRRDSSNSQAASEMEEFPAPEPFQGSDQASRLESKEEPSLKAIRRRATLLEGQDRQVSKIEQEQDQKVDSESFKSLAWSHLRPGFIIDHLNYSSFKVVFRTWITASLLTVMVVTDKTEKWLGNAAFIVLIFSMILAPGGMTWIMACIAVLTAYTYCIFAWGSSVAVQVIAWRVRGRPSQNDIFRALISDGTCTRENLRSCFQDAMFHGRWLSTKITMLYLINFMLIYVFLGSFSRNSPLRKISFIMGNILLAINTAFNALLPYFDPRLFGYVVIKPVSISFGMILLSSFVIFPVTANCKYVEGIIGLLQLVKATAVLEADMLAKIRVDSHDEDFDRFKNIRSARRKAARVFGLLDAHAATAKLELSYGRTNIGDIGELRSATRQLINSVTAFDMYYNNMKDRRDTMLEALSSRETHPKNLRRGSSFAGGTGENASKIYLMLHQSYKPVGQFESRKRQRRLRNFLQANQTEDLLDKDELLHMEDLTAKIYGDTMDSLSEVVEAVTKWLVAANNFRFYSLFTRKEHVRIQKQRHDELVAAHGKLKYELSKLDERRTAAHEEMEKKSPQLLVTFVSQNSLYGYLVNETAIACDRVIGLLLSIDELRPTPRFILPFSKSERQEATAMMSVEDYDDHSLNDTKYNLSHNTQQRDPDGSPPRNMIHLVGGKVIGLVRFLKQNYWLYFKVGLAGVLTMIPIFCRTTCYFYYSNRLIWLSLMVLFSASEIIADLAYSTIFKLVYTFFACILGMVGWYISRGNPIGVAAVEMVIIVLLAMYRHFSSNLTPIPAIIFAVTTQLVLGTSWLNQEINSFSNVGTGFKVAWIRFVTVIVGLAIGIIACSLPPSTGKKAVRMIMSHVLRDIGNLHCDIGKFALQRGEDEHIHISSRKDILENRIALIINRMAKTTPLMEFIRYEPPLTGIWPKSKYDLLLKLQYEVIILYYSLYHIFDQLDEPQFWISRLCNRFGWSDSNLIGDLFSVIYMSSVALASKRPLPRISTANLSERHLETLKKHSGILAESIETGVQSEKDETDIHQFDNEDFDKETLYSKDGQLGLVALTIVHLIYLRLDEMLLTIKKLVGEEFDVDRMLFLPEFDEFEKEALLARASTH